mmetsp:Transcript_12200/g.36518  ORF Transcript_12200/g.36518 Transcript_12200/m.36518 type:complete len:84 (+) Transcript_12200:273-524(+)
MQVQVACQRVVWFCPLRLKGASQSRHAGLTSHGPVPAKPERTAAARASSATRWGGGASSSKGTLGGGGGRGDKHSPPPGALTK